MITKDKLLKKKVGFVSLGCDKNRVDLEKMIYNIKSAGFEITFDIVDANIIIVNTCSFIESARQESVDTILNVITYKAKNCEKIIVTGCLNQMNYTDLDASFQDVDYFLKVKDNDNIVKTIFDLYGCDDCEKNVCFNDRYLTTPSHYSYLKISEGCNNFCSYCSIPFIRGRFISYPIDQLIKEAKQLVSYGVKELILVGQDVTKYGYDFDGKFHLVQLIKELSKIDGLQWIRLLYCYPELVDDQLIDEIKNNPKVVKYIDMPIQHINDDILKAMNRHTGKQEIIDTIKKLKDQIPQISIRSTFILGFPGETQLQFEEVLDFLKTYNLTNVGFFSYSREPGTRAYDFDNQITKSVKDKRVKLAYLNQQKVVEKNNNKLLNNVFDVIVDNFEDNFYICRSYMSAPDVDTVVYVKNNNKIKIGNIIKVKITNILNYDLEGEIYESSK